MIFNKEIKEKVIKMDLKSLIDLVIAFRISYANNNWNVNLIDLTIR